MDIAELAEYVIGLFTGVFAVPVYIVFLYMLIRYGNLAQFDTPFYHLVFQCGLLDLWYTLHQYIFGNHSLVCTILVTILPSSVFLWLNVPIATAVSYGYSYIRACQAISVLAISVNRFTALCMPLRHDLIWTRRLTWITYLCQHVVAVVIQVPRIAKGCVRNYVNVTNGTGYELGKPNMECLPLTMIPRIMLVSFVSFLLVLLYFVMFLKAYRSNISVGHGQQTNSQQKVHRNLAIGGAIISGTLVLNTIFLVLGLSVLRSNTSFKPALSVLRKTVDTLFCIVNPFVLLCFGSKVRPYYWKCVRQILCIKEKQPNQTSDLFVRQGISMRQLTTNKNNNTKIVDNRVVEENLL